MVYPGSIPSVGVGGLRSGLTPPQEDPGGSDLVRRLSQILGQSSVMRDMFEQFGLDRILTRRGPQLYGGSTLSGKGQGGIGGLLGELGGPGGTWMPSEWTGKVVGKPIIPERWQEGDPLVPRTDPEEIIRLEKARSMEGMRRGMAEAAGRLGSAGALGGGMGSGYGRVMGDIARRSARDMAEIGAKYGLQAAESERMKEFQADQARRERDLRAHQLQSGMEFESGQRGLDRSLSAWGKLEPLKLQALRQAFDMHMQRKGKPGDLLGMLKLMIAGGA